MWWVLVLTSAKAETAAEVAALAASWAARRASPAAVRISTSEYARALQGERIAGVAVVEGVAASKAYGVAVLDVSATQVWKAVNDTPHQLDYFPIDRMATASGTPRRDGYVLFQYLELPIVSDRWWIVQYRFNRALYQASGGRAWELTWEDKTHDATQRARLDAGLHDEGVPVAWTRGAWYAIQLSDGRSVVEYNVWTDPGGAIPAGAAASFGGGEVKSALEAIERMAREHLPSCSASYAAPDGSPL